jgi:tetratricopeptide (TPR) repeat protein
MQIHILPQIEKLTFEKDVIYEVLELLKSEQMKLELDNQAYDLKFIFAIEKDYLVSAEIDDKTFILIPSIVKYTPHLRGYLVYETKEQLKLILLAKILKEQQHIKLKYVDDEIFLNEQKLAIDLNETPYFDQHKDIKTLAQTIKLYEALSKLDETKFANQLKQAKLSLKDFQENVVHIVDTYDYVLQVDQENDITKAALEVLQFSHQYLDEQVKTNQEAFDRLNEIYEEAMQLEKQVSSEKTTVTKYCQFLEDVYLPYLNENQADDIVLLAEITHKLAKSFTEDSRYQDAEYYQSQALKLKQIILKQNLDDEKNKVSLAKTYENMSYLHMIEQRIMPAIDFNQKALEVYLSLNHETYQIEIANLYFSIAILEDNIDEKELAITHFLKAQSFRKYDEKIQTKVFTAKIYSNLGSLYYKTEDQVQSKEAYRHALKYYRYLTLIHPKKYQQSLASTLYMIALIEHQDKHYDDALLQFKEAIFFFEQESEVEAGVKTFELAKSLTGIALVYKGLEKNIEAREYFEKSLENYQKLDQVSPKAYDSFIADIKQNLGNIHLNENKKDEAIKAYQEALELYNRHAQARPQQFYVKIAYIHKALANLYVELQKYEDAASHFEDLMYFYDDLIKFDFSTHAKDLVDIYVAYAKVEHHLDHKKDAINYAKKAMKLSQKMMKEQPHNIILSFSSAHEQLAQTLESVEKPKKAHKVIASQVDLLNRHLASYKDADANKRMEWLRALADAYRAQKDEENAVLCLKKVEQLEKETE